MLSSTKPSEASRQEIQSKPTGDNLSANGPAKCRITNINPLTYTSSQIPFMPTVRVKAISTHWPGASSDAAVKNMHKNQMTNNARSTSLIISPADTPAATRSVGGNL